MRRKGDLWWEVRARRRQRGEQKGTREQEGQVRGVIEARGARQWAQ